jgi:APA family basic amino acid/polyamine antiporter
VYLPHLLIGLGLIVLLTLLNYRGIRSSASFQNWTAFGTLALFVTFVGVGVTKGSVSNFPPLFTHGRFVSILLVMQIVPYFMTGYESAVKGAEEASPDFDAGGFSKAMAIAIAVGILFYTIIIAAVGYVAPWRQLTQQKFMTAVAFERAVGSRWIVGAILAAALLSLVKCFNGNFVAASRLLFAMARRGLVANPLARIHTQNHTPYYAVIWVGIATAVCMFLGDAILVPVTEVGSVASAAGWLAACASYYRMRPAPSQRSVALVGAVLGLLMVLMKIVPFVPGHFSRYEWLALTLWVSLGMALKRSPRAAVALSGQAIGGDRAG